MLRACLLLAVPMLAGDWPQILGPARDGRYDGPFAAQPSFKKIWERKVGEGFSAPVLARGRLLIYHRAGNEDLLESLDPATGKMQWTHRAPTAYRDDFGFNEGPRATPTADDGRVYLFSAESVLRAVDLATGKQLWEVSFRSRKEYFGAASSPVVEDDILLVNAGGLFALDKRTGKQVWTAVPDEAGYSSPVVATIGGERHALFFTRTGLVDVEPKTGRVRFQMRWRSRQAASVNAALPLAIGNLVFLSASYNTGATLLEVQGDRYTQLWEGDDQLSNHYATSVHHEGFLYGFHGRQEMGQELRAVELRTGKVQWSIPVKAGTVALLKDQLLVVTESGEAWLGPASPKGFKPAKRQQLLPAVVRPYPAIASGVLYLRNENTLAAFSLQ
jgi:outer membrane protein assembly factor BamB